MVDAHGGGVAEQRLAILFELGLERLEVVVLELEIGLPELRDQRVVGARELVARATALRRLREDVVVDDGLERPLIPRHVLSRAGAHVSLLAMNPLPRVRAVLPLDERFLEAGAVGQEDVVAAAAEAALGDVRGPLRLVGYARNDALGPRRGGLVGPVEGAVQRGIG